MRPDRRGRILLKPLGLWLAVEDQRAVCYDADTGERLRDYGQERRARQGAEQQARDKAGAERRAREAAEARQRAEEQARQEVEARRRAERRVRDLEAELRRLRWR
jgi:hypothetical protein